MTRKLNTTVLHDGVVYEAGTDESQIDNADGITAPGVWDGEAHNADASGKPAKVPTIAEIEKEVGDDPVKAQAALDAENARDEADRRSTLLEKLQAIVDAGTSS